MEGKALKLVNPGKLPQDARAWYVPSFELRCNKNVCHAPVIAKKISSGAKMQPR
jgi:hypothetical protein